MHLNSDLLFGKYGQTNIVDRMKVLEIGPNGFPSTYYSRAMKHNLVWHTIDFADSRFIKSANSDLTYVLENPYNFPIKDDEYDIVVSGQVIEHVHKIWVWLKEIKRVLRKGGLIITINPVSWPYHEAPVDCWRIYPEGIRALADELGLEVVLCQCESLEKELIADLDAKGVTIPGRSYTHYLSKDQLARIVRWNKLARRLPYFRSLEIPVEVSYDTISILRKR